MAKYFDKRHGEWRTVPDCSKLGLTWSPKSQRCERGLHMLGRLMGEFDFSEDYYGGYLAESGIGDSYGGGGWGGFDFSSDIYGGGGNYGGYGYYDGGYYSDQLNFDDLYGGGSSSGGYDPYLDYLNDYIAQGYDAFTAADLAAQDTQYHFEDVTIEREAPPVLPPMMPSDWWNIPYQSYLPSFESPPYTPYEPPAPEPPPLPPSPATQPGLPPACAPGTYHPYPIGHPQQNICVPFPSTQQQAPRPQAQSSGGSPQQSRPPQTQTSQPCGSGSCKHPQTGQCIPIPAGYMRDAATQICRPQTQPQACPSGTYRDSSTGQCRPAPQCSTPGTVFDARVGRCVPYAQAQQPICPPGYSFDQSRRICALSSSLPPGAADGDILNSLKNIPWWLWGLGLFLLLGKDSDNGGRKTTVVHRRSS